MMQGIKKSFKRIVAMLMAVAMVVGVAPTMALARDVRVPQSPAPLSLDPVIPALSTFALATIATLEGSDFNATRTELLYGECCCGRSSRRSVEASFSGMTQSDVVRFIESLEATGFYSQWPDIDTNNISWWSDTNQSNMIRVSVSWSSFAASILHVRFWYNGFDFELMHSSLRPVVQNISNFLTNDRGAGVESGGFDGGIEPPHIVLAEFSNATTADTNALISRLTSQLGFRELSVNREQDGNYSGTEWGGFNFTSRIGIFFTQKSWGSGSNAGHVLNFSIWLLNEDIDALHPDLARGVSDIRAILNNRFDNPTLTSFFICCCNYYYYLSYGHDAGIVTLSFYGVSLDGTRSLIENLVHRGFATKSFNTDDFGGIPFIGWEGTFHNLEVWITNGFGGISDASAPLSARGGISPTSATVSPFSGSLGSRTITIHIRLIDDDCDCACCENANCGTWCHCVGCGDRCWRECACTNIGTPTYVNYAMAALRLQFVRSAVEFAILSIQPISVNVTASDFETIIRSAVAPTLAANSGVSMDFNVAVQVINPGTQWEAQILTGNIVYSFDAALMESGATAPINTHSVHVSMTEEPTLDIIIIETTTAGNSSSINLNNETINLVLPAGVTQIAEFSVDGGRRWRRATALPAPVNGRNALFNRALELHVRTERGCDDFVIVFPAINARPRANHERLRPWYTATSWSLNERPVRDNSPTNAPDATALNYQRVDGDDRGRLPANPVWDFVPAGTSFDIPAVGTRENHWFRAVATRPTATTGIGANTRYTPAGAPFRIRPAAFRRALNVRINYNLEELRMRAGQQFLIANVIRDSDGNVTSYNPVFSINDGLWGTTTLDTRGRPAPLDVTPFITEQQTIMLRASTNGRRPGTAPQFITPLTRLAVPTTVAINPANGRINGVADNRAFNVQVDGRWRAIPRVTASTGTNPFVIRANPTARFARGAWSGNAASLNGHLHVTVVDGRVTNAQVTAMGALPSMIFAPDMPAFDVDTPDVYVPDADANDANASYAPDTGVGDAYVAYTPDTDASDAYVAYTPDTGADNAYDAYTIYTA